MHRKYRKLVSAGLVLTMAGAMTLQGCGQKEETGKTEIELVQYKPEAVKTFEKIEEEFNIEFVDEDLDQRNFVSVDEICRTINKYIK